MPESHARNSLALPEKARTVLRIIIGRLSLDQENETTGPAVFIQHGHSPYAVLSLGRRDLGILIGSTGSTECPRIH